MSYLPAAASLAATHKGRIKNIRSAALRESKEERNPGFVILTFEEECLSLDRSLLAELGYPEHMNVYSERGHSYIRDYSLNPSFTWVLSMSPMMASILSKAEFVEVDATFKASLELEYLFNTVCFDYELLQWAVVARVRMNKLDSAAYTFAFRALFDCAKKSCPNFGIGKTLKGIVADWSDAQLQGLQGAIGEDQANKMMKGCLVHYQRSVKRVSERVNSGSSSQAHRAFTTIAFQMQ